MATTYKQAQHSRFQRGSGAFHCEVCGRLTRDTGDAAVGSRLCADCWEIAGIDNAYNDEGRTPQPNDEYAADLASMLANIAAKGGNVDRVTDFNSYAFPNGTPAVQSQPTRSKTMTTKTEPVANLTVNPTTGAPTMFYRAKVEGVVVTITHVRGRRYAVEAKGKRHGYMLARTPVDAINRVEVAARFADFVASLQKVDTYLARRAEAAKAKAKAK